MHCGKAGLQACSALPCWCRPGPAGTWGLHSCQVQAQPIPFYSIAEHACSDSVPKPQPLGQMGLVGAP